MYHKTTYPFLSVSFLHFVNKCFTFIKIYIDELK